MAAEPGIEGVEPVTEASLDAIEKKIRKKLREFRALADGTSPTTCWTPTAAGVSATKGGPPTSSSNASTPSE